MGVTNHLLANWDDPPSRSMGPCVAELAAQDLRPDIITQNTILTAAVGILSDSMRRCDPIGSMGLVYLPTFTRFF